jgi:hypothetical protein
LAAVSIGFDEAARPVLFSVFWRDFGLEPNADANARPGLAFAVCGTRASVGQIVDAIAEEIAMLARAALIISDAFSAKPYRANVGLALAVRSTDSIVAQVVLAIANEIAVLALAAPTVAHTLGTEPHRTNPREAFCVCSAHAVVADIGDAHAE